ncbi:MAG: CRISPR-associated ring nuclease [Burkholderiaceae bacterium]|nr:CRISPR-associated ring nuclease [Burkholderiaceae bacterium]
MMTHSIPAPLVCTLGITWQVIPEIYGFLAPQRCPIYAAVSGHAEQLRARAVLTEPSELWVVTTAGTAGEERLRAWWRALGEPVPLRLWRTAAIDTSAQEEVELIRELIHRAVLHAGPQALLCLAGGRKTMSADMQRAGMLYGCQAMLHVLPPEGERQKQLNSHDFLAPLPADLAASIQPVFVGRAARADLVDLPPALVPTDYPLPDPSQPFAADGRWLNRDIERRQAEGSHLLVAFHHELAKDEAHENWRSLYRLPPAIIHRLRTLPLTCTQRGWLTALPKAELHCHIGGILDLEEQIAVGRTVWSSLSPSQRVAASVDAERWLADTEQPGGQRWHGLPPPRRAAAAACLLATRDPEDLERHLWGPTQPRVALKRHHRWGFAAYEHPGSLVGSTLLQLPEAIHAYAAAIRARCRRDGIAYLELRCSPAKYHPEFLAIFAAALTSARQPDESLVRLILIADRRDEAKDPARILATVRQALDARERFAGLVVGLDLAGDEQRGQPEGIAPLFQEAFAECLRLTIHAGEGEEATNIWKAAYVLHADRIGHGLSLADAPALAARFRDRRICLELCPTSNREVVGFRDPALPETAAFPAYPLRALLELGVPLTLCTDNPGISRTTLADEYVAAARMTEHGLSCWEALAIIKQGFLYAFLPAKEREALVKKIDVRIAELARSLAEGSGAFRAERSDTWRR